MRVSKENLQLISIFENRLMIAFRKMILGINVELTDEGRKYWGKENLGRWFFIQAIHDDETLTVVSQTHQIFVGLKLSHINI